MPARNPIAASLGRVGLPAPIATLAATTWDCVVVGGGHNGLTAAAYLARAGRSVLVLEARERLGGARALDEPLDGIDAAISPCAYVVGLLDEVVIRELELRRRGYRAWIADPNLWVPFRDGTSFGQFLDDARTQADLEALGVSREDMDGYWAYEHVFDAIRRRLRTGQRDTWIGASPTRAEIEALLAGEQLMQDIVFDASIAEVLDEFMDDARLKDALFGQGLIAAYAGPYDKGTASIKLMHYQGDMEGQGPVWGYVEGGMGMVSFAIADAAVEHGAQLATGVAVAQVLPGEGVVLEDGTTIRARAVVCNADPKVALRLLDGQDVPEDYRRRLEAWKVRSPVVKFNAALDRKPAWAAARGAEWVWQASVDLSYGMEACQRAFERCDRGEPDVAFGEVYLQTGFDTSAAPDGVELLSVFGQYAPYDLAEGTWESRREDVAQQFIALIETYAPGFRDTITAYEVLGPPDIEARVGLTGGNIFQGEVTPDQMWTNRLTPRTPVEGLYFCGAATHPAGSVIALNGRNAAEAVLEDTGTAARTPVGA